MSKRLQFRFSYRWIALLAIVSLGLAACGSAATSAAPTNAPAEAPTEGATSAPTEANLGAQPSVTVSDQAVMDGKVVVDSVTAAESGWIVIHADNDGAPGPVVGHTAVEAGTTNDVAVDVDTGKVTPTLYAMLHVDTGAAGEYDFPDADPPVKVDGQIVVKGFQASMESAQASGTTIGVAQLDLGTALVGPDGRTLYAFTGDSGGQIACVGGCLDSWPPFITDGQPRAGDGVDASLLGTIEREDGSVQVTYAGSPLYFSADDAAPGDTKGQAFNDAWFAVSADGTLINDGGQTDTGGAGSGGLY